MSLEKARALYHPPLPHMLQKISHTAIKRGPKTSSISHSDELKKLFPNTFGQETVELIEGGEHKGSPKRIGVVLSGGQAPGGHNVIAGLFDALNAMNSSSILFGFLEGPKGIIESSYKELGRDLIARYRNQGGFDLIGSGRTKIETPEQLKASLETMKKLNLDGLVVIGGDDSNTNAAILAEYFKVNGCKTCVVGVPKTIDGDLKNQEIEISFGHDTASKVYSEIIGNILRDALSAKKYYHFIKLMGRTASHITLECALKTHPNAALISEEIALKKTTLQEIISGLCDIICERAKQGKDYGAILIPEGLVEFIPEMSMLIAELNKALADKAFSSRLEECKGIGEKVALIAQAITPSSMQCLQSLPEGVCAQFLLDRDPHGNVQVSHIETEQLMIHAVKRELAARKKIGLYAGKFTPVAHFLGYEGRSAFPSNFDSAYCYALGHVAAVLINGGLTGYMSRVSRLSHPVEEWTAGGIPITMMMTVEQRKGLSKPVIQKALVNLQGKPFKTFAASRHQWALEDHYCYPGPIQFFGSKELTDGVTETLKGEQGKMMSDD